MALVDWVGSSKIDEKSVRQVSKRAMTGSMASERILMFINNIKFGLSFFLESRLIFSNFTLP
jgi:hypothetical protein